MRGMDAKTRLQWLCTFSVLGLFSWSVVAGLVGSPAEVALARDLVRGSPVGAATVFVATSPRRQPAPGLGRVLQRLRAMIAEERELCGLSRPQAEALARTYATSLGRLEGAEFRAEVLAFRDGVPTGRELRKLLSLAGGDTDVHCRRLTIYERVYLLLASRVS